MLFAWKMILFRLGFLAFRQNVEVILKAFRLEGLLITDTFFTQIFYNTPYFMSALFTSPITFDWIQPLK